MSGSERNTATVTRSYEPAAEHCSQALALLLRVPVHQRAARSAAPNDGKARSDEFPVSSIIPKRP
jgi:hypothetical protein